MSRDVKLPYLWPAKGRGGKLYFFYRRDGVNFPITSPEGTRLKPGDPGFYEAFAAIDANFGVKDPEGPKVGTIAHLVQEYRRSGEFTTNIGLNTRGQYERYMTEIVQKHGNGMIAKLPREAAYKIRDDYKTTPSLANMILQMLNILLNFAEERPLTFRLPVGWRNPARKMTKLKTGEGFRPWEEYEIDDFRAEWAIGTLERVIFEAFLNTGQRGIDIAPMKRRHYYSGEISVKQLKTGKRVWIPASRDLRAALNPWLRGHNHDEIFRTPTGLKALAPGYMRQIMRAAFEKAGLPEDCTLHGLRYTFATRAAELGLDIRDSESIIGHETTEMMWKYIRQRRNARLTIEGIDRGLENRRVRIDVIEDELLPAE